MSEVKAAMITGACTLIVGIIGTLSTSAVISNKNQVVVNNILSGESFSVSSEYAKLYNQLKDEYETLKTENKKVNDENKTLVSEVEKLKNEKAISAASLNTPIHEANDSVKASETSYKITPYSKDTYYYEYPERGSFKMAGQQYYSGAESASSGKRHALYNLEAKYKQLNGVYGITDASSNGAKGTINFYGDENLLKSFDVKYGDLPKKFDLKLDNVVQLKIEFTGSSHIAIADIEVRWPIIWIH